MNRVISRSF